MNLIEKAYCLESEIKKGVDEEIAQEKIDV